MADRRRRRLVSDADSEDLSSEGEHEVVESESKNSSEKASQKKEADKPDSEYESAEGEGENQAAPRNQGLKTKSSEDDLESPTELIDEEGGEEGIAEPEEVGEEFLDQGLIDATDEDDEEAISNGVSEKHQRGRRLRGGKTGGGTGEERGDEDDDDDVEEGVGGEEDDDEEEEEECVEEERQQGDGEECSPTAEKELDYDEDRRNPQYIPKKGTFYEHDDRNVESPKEKETETTRDKKKKKLWLDEGKWGHDRYREDEQIPKSRDELIEVYGYDIRCEDGPPRARRRRRYGRGPTKYERNWKDETAYAKLRGTGVLRGRPRGSRGRGRGRGRGGFRGNTTYSNSGRRVYEESEKSEPETDFKVRHPVSSIPSAETTTVSNGWDRRDSTIEEVKPVIDNKEFPALPSKENVTKEQTSEHVYNRRQIPAKPEPQSYINNNNNNNNSSNNNSVKSQTFENSNFTSKTVSYDRSPRRGKVIPFRGSYRGAYKRPPRTTRGRRGSSSGRYNNRPSYHRPNLAPRLMDKQIRAINSEIDRLTIHDRSDGFDAQEVVDEDEAQEQNKSTGNRGNEAKQISSSLPPSSKNEDSSSRPKRYSSLRQRGVQETSSYQPTQSSVPSLPPQHAPYYETGYQAAMYTTDSTAASSQPQPAGSPPIISPPQYQTYNYQDSYALRLPVNNTPPRLFPQVTLPAGQTIIAPTPPCITPNPGIINYPPPPPPPSTAYPQFTYQQYPTPPPPPPPPPVSQPPDMYRGGITYYFPQTQPPPLRHVPQKRPKAAIPIVPPPESETKVAEKKELSSLEVQLNSSTNSGATNSADSAETSKVEPSVVQTQAAVEVES